MCRLIVVPVSFTFLSTTRFIYAYHIQTVARPTKKRRIKYIRSLLTKNFSLRIAKKTVCIHILNGKKLSATSAFLLYFNVVCQNVNKTNSDVGVCSDRRAHSMRHEKMCACVCLHSVHIKVY